MVCLSLLMSDGIIDNIDNKPAGFVSWASKMFPASPGPFLFFVGLLSVGYNNFYSIFVCIAEWEVGLEAAIL